jgi:hypothetical protein
MDGHGETSILPYNFVARGKKIIERLTSVLIAEKTLPGTYVKIHITNSKPFKTSDLYDVVYKVIKIKFEQFHSYQYNLQAFEKHRSLLSTFSMLRYLVVMYLCAIDIYFASFYDCFAPRNEVVREYTGFTMSVALILCSIQHGYIKLTQFTIWTH